MDIFKNVQKSIPKKTFEKNVLLKTLPENCKYFVSITRNNLILLLKNILSVSALNSNPIYIYILLQN